MEMELISRETIRPSSPTPPHLRIHALSFIDNLICGNNYLPLVYFYSKESYECDDNPSKIACDQESKISKLKKSLSEVLSRYYPLAGRFRDQLSIDCNDEGALLLVARIRCKLSAVLQNPSDVLINPLFANELQWKDMSNSSESLVAIQINCFTCGGMAISVCMSHKFGDASTLFNFVNDWATLNQESSDEGELTNPVLDAGASVFPQGDLLVFPEIVFSTKNTVCRRFVFEASKIESLKVTVSSRNHEVKNPTRVEVVTALIYKSAVSALGLSAKNTPLSFIVNLRKRMVPPLPEKSTGNIAWSVYVFSQIMDNREVDLHDLIRKMREGISEFCDKFEKSLRGEYSSFISDVPKEANSTSVPFDNEKKQTLFFSSWCRFPTYKVDFGWGKPIWVTTTGCLVRNSIILMDTRDGSGIEALVNMAEEDMARFERDVELLQYASL